MPHAEFRDLPQTWDAVVVGGGIAGLAAAWECVQHGLRPLLVEARGYTGGLVAAAPIGGVRMDLGAEGFVMRGAAVTEMVDALGLDVVGPSGGARLYLPPLPESDSTHDINAAASSDDTSSDDTSNPLTDRATFPPTVLDQGRVCHFSRHTRGGSSTLGGEVAHSAQRSRRAHLGTRSARGWELHPFVRDSFLGIPASPLAEDAVRVLGRAGAERAAADADLPGEVGTRPEDPPDLASFVRARMGEAVLDRLVRPIVAGIHTADPADLAADTVAPGLRAATARLGSLQAAVAELIEARKARRRAGTAADVTTPGGLVVLTDHLRAAIEEAGGEILTRTGARHLRPSSPMMSDAAACRDPQVSLPAGLGEAGERSEPAGCASAVNTAAAHRWAVTIAPTRPGATPSAEPVPAGEERTILTDRLILACSVGAAKRLLASAGVDADLEIPEGSPIARAMLVIRSESLNGQVGSGLLVAPPPCPDDSPCPVQAKALSHLNVKWPWIGEELATLHGEHVHALRLSYGRPGEPSPQPGLAQILADASALTGVELHEEDVIDHKVIHWDGTLPPVTPEFRARTREIVAEANERAGLALTGAWVAGTGIASVVAHARTQAARLCAGDAQISAGPAAHNSGDSLGTAAPQTTPTAHPAQDQVNARATEASASEMTGPSGHEPEGEKQE